MVSQFKNNAMVDGRSERNLYHLPDLNPGFEFGWNSIIKALVDGGVDRDFSVHGGIH
jgi:hypothetical protein